MPVFLLFPKHVAVETMLCVHYLVSSSWEDVKIFCCFSCSEVGTMTKFLPKEKWAERYNTSDSRKLRGSLNPSCTVSLIYEPGSAEAKDSGLQDESSNPEFLLQESWPIGIRLFLFFFNERRKATEIMGFIYYLSRGYPTLTNYTHAMLFLILVSR